MDISATWTSFAALMTESMTEEQFVRLSGGASVSPPAMVGKET